MSFPFLKILLAWSGLLFAFLFHFFAKTSNASLSELFILAGFISLPAGLVLTFIHNWIVEYLIHKRPDMIAPDRVELSHAIFYKVVGVIVLMLVTYAIHPLLPTPFILYFFIKKFLADTNQSFVPTIKPLPSKHWLILTVQTLLFLLSALIFIPAVAFVIMGWMFVGLSGPTGINQFIYTCVIAVISFFPFWQMRRLLNGKSILPLSLVVMFWVFEIALLIIPSNLFDYFGPRSFVEMIYYSTTGAKPQEAIEYEKARDEWYQDVKKNGLPKGIDSAPL